MLARASRELGRATGRVATRWAASSGYWNSGREYAGTAFTTAAFAAGAVAMATATEDRKSGDVYTWGWGQFGQLGTGEESDAAEPEEIEYLRGHEVVSVVSGPCARSSAVVTSDGSLFTFGCGNDARLGHGAAARHTAAPNQKVPRRVDGIDGKVVSAAVGETHMAAVTLDGRLYTFGKDTNGKLGHTNDRPGYAQQVEGLEGQVVSVACGRIHTAAVTSDGRVWTWGDGRSGALGHGDRKSLDRPKAVEGFPAGTKAAEVRCGRDFTLVLTQDGKVYGFGGDDHGALGSGYSSRFHTSPVPIKTGSSRLVGVAAGEGFSVLIDSDGQVFTCGSNVSGQLSHGDRSDVGIPRRVEALKDQRIKAAAAGGGHALLLNDKGQVLAVGRGRNGQLGRGDSLESVAAYRTTPVQVTALPQPAIMISAGSDHSMALVAKK